MSELLKEIHRKLDLIIWILKRKNYGSITEGE